MLCYYSIEMLQVLRQEYLMSQNVAGIETRVLDVTNKQDVENFAKSIDHVDILFNCAG